MIRLQSIFWQRTLYLLPLTILFWGEQLGEGREQIGTLHKSWFVLSSHCQANK